MHALGNDLSTLRKQHDLSLDDVQKRTRIALTTLQAIEDGTIFDELDENTTYIRNYVRSYARAVGIDEGKIVIALDQVQQGNYKGLLLKEEDVPPPVEEETEIKEDASETDIEPKKHDDKKKKNVAKKHYPAEKGFSSADWVNIHQKNKRRRSSTSRKKLLWGIIILCLILIALFFIYRYYIADSSSTNAQIEHPAAQKAPPTPSDSLQQALVKGKSPITNGKATSTQRGMPDTLSIAIIAATGKLEPVHVFTDIISRTNPYWVAKHDTLSFKLVNTVHIQAANQYDHLQLMVNGHTLQNAYEKYYKAKAGSLELNRSDFRPFY